MKRSYRLGLKGARRPHNAFGRRKARGVMDENCEKIKKMLDLYREGKLTDSEKADVEYHLLYCPECIFLLTIVPSLN